MPAASSLRIDSSGSQMKPRDSFEVFGLFGEPLDVWLSFRNVSVIQKYLIMTFFEEFREQREAWRKHYCDRLERREREEI